MRICSKKSTQNLFNGCRLPKRVLFVQNGYKRTGKGEGGTGERRGGGVVIQRFRVTASGHNVCQWAIRFGGKPQACCMDTSH